MNINLTPDNKAVSQVSATSHASVTSPAAAGEQCPRCGTGKVARELFKTGGNADRPFIGCNRFPACKFFNWAH